MLAGCYVPALRAAEESELKDEAGKKSSTTSWKPRPTSRPAGTTDPARQVGVIFCLQEHTLRPARISTRFASPSSGWD